MRARKNPGTALRTLEHVRRELARVYRRVKAGEIPSEEGSKRAYILSTLSKIIEAADLERRIAAIEQQQRELSAISPTLPRCFKGIAMIKMIA